MDLAFHWNKESHKGVSPQLDSMAFRRCVGTETALWEHKLRNHLECLVFRSGLVTVSLKYNNHFQMGSGGEVVTSPPLNRKVGSSMPTMIRDRCLRVKQHYPAQKNNPTTLSVILNQGLNSGSP